MLEQNGATSLPFFFVGKTITNQRIQRFAATKHQLLSENLQKQDTKAIWYTKDHIELLLEEMKKAEADGLRIYFGAYGENENYSGQLCLLMVMTTAGPNGSHVDITIEDAPDYQARSIDEDRPRDFNVGSPCPPICDEGIDYPKEDLP